MSATMNLFVYQDGGAIPENFIEDAGLLFPQGVFDATGGLVPAVVGGVLQDGYAVVVGQTANGVRVTMAGNFPPPLTSAQLSDGAAVSAWLAAAAGVTLVSVRIEVLDTTSGDRLVLGYLKFNDAPAPSAETFFEDWNLETLMALDPVVNDGTLAGKTFTGTDGDDGLTGSRGHDVMSGLDGADTLHAGGGRDTVDGGAGDDLLIGESGDDRLYGGTGTDRLFGGSGNDLIEGGYQDDRLFGGEGDDTLDGGRRNDLLSGGAGNDFLKGSYEDDTLIGGAGDDTLDGGRGDDRLYGGEGNDLLRGLIGFNVLFGGAGDDLLRTGSGSDSAYGGLGNDTIVLSDKGGYARGSYGNDEIYIGIGVYPDESTVLGGSGDDKIDLATGRNEIFGGAGHDRITSSGAAGSQLFGGAGGDSITGGGGADLIYGGVGHDTIHGNAGQDTLYGGSGADYLSATGDALIYGGHGADTISSGVGRDTVFGGGGGDTFFFAAGKIGTYESRRLEIEDFNVADHDRIRLFADPSGGKPWTGDFDDFLRDNVIHANGSVVLIFREGLDSIVLSGVTDAETLRDAILF